MKKLTLLFLLISQLVSAHVASDKMQFVSQTQTTATFSSCFHGELTFNITTQVFCNNCWYFIEYDGNNIETIVDAPNPGCTGADCQAVTPFITTTGSLCDNNAQLNLDFYIPRTDYTYVIIMKDTQTGLFYDTVQKQVYDTGQHQLSVPVTTAGIYELIIQLFNDSWGGCSVQSELYADVFACPTSIENISPTYAIHEQIKQVSYYTMLGQQTEFIPGVLLIKKTEYSTGQIQYSEIIKQ